MGYSGKNPHLPDGWDSGNSHRRGGSKTLEIQAGGGVELRHCILSVDSTASQAEQFFTCASKDAELLAKEDNSKEFWSKHSLFVENTREELVAICTSKKLLET